MPKRIKVKPTPDLNQPLTAKLLGEVISARRTQSHLRLEDTAQLCGLAKQTLMRIEHGEESCQFDTILQVCKQLGIKLSILPWQQSDNQHDEWH